MPKGPYDKPIEAVAEQGEILLDGPDGLATSLTPNAALASAKRLSQAVRDADDDANGGSVP